MIAIGAGEAVHFDSADSEQGNAEKGWRALQARRSKATGASNPSATWIWRCSATSGPATGC